MRQKTMRILTATTLVLTLSACTTIPQQIEGTYSDISPARVEPAVFGQTVRWGGTLIDARVEKDSTCFEVLSRELDKYLRPRLEDRTAGRFIACKSGFYDPEVFARGREVTLTGRIRNIEERPIDEFTYRYPVVDVDQLVLWEVREEVMVIDYPYDPFYYPYYWNGPYWGYYPYYRHGYPMHHRGYARTRQLLPDPAEVH
jgi:outer membrane lipoprotein